MSCCHLQLPYTLYQVCLLCIGVTFTLLQQFGSSLSRLFLPPSERGDGTLRICVECFVEIMKQFVPSSEQKLFALSYRMCFYFILFYFILYFKASVIAVDYALAYFRVLTVRASYLLLLGF